MPYLKSLGYLSGVFAAKYSGGKCGLSGTILSRGDHVAFFMEFGLCHDAAINEKIRANDNNRT